MAKLTKLLKESIDQHKRKVYLKAAIDMATSYSRRGYTQDEAIKDAAQGIKNVYGYELTPQDIEAVKHFVPVNAQFKEIVVKPTKAYHYCILGGVDENIIGFKDVLNKEDFRKSVIRARKQNPNFKFAFDWLNDNEPFFAEPYSSQDPSFRNDDEINEPDEIMTFDEWATTVVNSDRIPSYLKEIIVKATFPNTWEYFEKCCAQQLASRLKMDDKVSVIEVAGRDDDKDLGIQTVRDALRLYIERCKQDFEDEDDRAPSIDNMISYWNYFAGHITNIEELAENTVQFIARGPIWYDLMVDEELGFELHLQEDSDSALGEIVVKPSGDTFKEDVANFIDDVLSYMKRLTLPRKVLQNGAFIDYIESFADDLPDELDADDETRKRFDELWYDKIIPLARKNRSDINTLEDYIQFFEKAKKL